MISLHSPDETINVQLEIGANGLFYQLAYQDETIVRKSQCSFDFVDAESLNSALKVVNSSIKSVDETWQPVYGKKSEIRNQYNELRVECVETNAQARHFTFVFRLYDDGVAFCFEFPETFAEDSLLIQSENTEFRFADNLLTWFIPANYESYEMLYDSIPLSRLETANTPITFEHPQGNYVLSLHEAALQHYAGMTLSKSETDSLALLSELVPWPDGVKVKTTLPAKTPWRSLQIASTAAGLIESDLILNLNDPCVIQDCSWIRPIKCIGIWWGMHLGTQTWTADERHGATTERMLEYLEFAKDHGFDGVLAEGWNTGWENWGQANAFDQVTPTHDFDLLGLAETYQSENIHLIGHHETGGDITAYERMMDSAMALYHSLGIHYLKTGYAGAIRPQGYYHHSQFMIEHYRKVVEMAAKYELNLNVHEPIKATGLSRTYPNMMTREGARGMEWNAWSAGNPPNHHLILPFTRCLGGPLDYTPGIFDLLYENAGERVKWNDLDDGTSRVNTTLAKQLALFVLFYSPIQMASDCIQHYENHPAFAFIKAVPVDWASQRVLHAEIGESLCIARKDKHSENWFLGAITNEIGRKRSIPCDFLDADKTYRAIIYQDAETTDWKSNPTAYSIEEKPVHSTDSLHLQLAAGGGAAVHFKCSNP
jgi:alpha-glucosidase